LEERDSFALLIIVGFIPNVLKEKFVGRWVRQSILISIDAILVNLASFLAFFLRFDGAISEFYLKIFWQSALVLTFLRLVSFLYFGLYHHLWEYASIKELLTIGKAVSLSSGFFIFYLLFLRISEYPRGVLILDWLLCLFGVGGSRLCWRLFRERIFSRNLPYQKRALIFGAGDAGEMVAREMLRHPEMGWTPVGFIDDRGLRVGLKIHCLPILGTQRDIPRIVQEKKIDELVLAIPEAGKKRIQEIVQKYKDSRPGGLVIKSVPGLFEWIKGGLEISQIKEIKMEELLSRQEISSPWENRVEEVFRGETVLITGAAGSIGSEVCRQLLTLKPRSLLLFDHYENGLYYLNQELKAKVNSPSVIPIIGDIRDRKRVEQVMEQYQPDIVFHAAAHKHVPLMEKNPEEALKNNVIGTLIVARASVQFNVERFILISTDKAVRPLCVMGATKRLAELLIQAMAKREATRFCAVRFGNVLGSEGSVIPIFKRQLSQGRPLTITHPQAVRYFMTIPEAVQLVIRASTLGERGEIFILDMGRPIKIVDLANNLIRLLGLEDIEIKFTGLRPGEKLKEELYTPDEEPQTTPFDKILVLEPNSFDGERIYREVEELEKRVTRMDREEILIKLEALIPDYHRFQGSLLNLI